MPAYQIIVSPTALQDVQQIWDYIALQNADAATRVTDEIWLGFHHLGRFPNSGDVRTDLAEIGRFASGGQVRTSSFTAQQSRALRSPASCMEAAISLPYCGIAMTTSGTERWIQSAKCR